MKNISNNYIKLNYDYTKHGSNGREKEPEIMTMLGFHDKYCNFAFTNYSGKSINEDVEVVVYKRDYDEFGDIEIIEYDRIIIEPEMISGNKTVYLGYCHNNEWYKDGIYGSDKVEFSHCFGKITSGIDMSNSDKDYHVHTIHNIENNRPSYIRSPGKALEDDITIDSDDYLDDNCLSGIMRKCIENRLDLICFSSFSRWCSS